MGITALRGIFTTCMPTSCEHGTLLFHCSVCAVIKIIFILFFKIYF